MKNRKTYSETELKDLAVSALERFSNADSVFATTDGNIFLDKNRAELHAQKGRVIQIDRALAAVEATELPRISAKEAISLIESATMEDLAAFANDTRKTVQDAISKRLDALGVNLNDEEE